MKELQVMIGGKLGRYEILEVLGRGGQSIAYKARDPKIDRIVAIKQILSKQGMPAQAREEFLARFMREAQAAGRLSHPNIATIYDVGGDEEGEPYIAMEYVDGWDLDELIRREHPLSQARVLRLFVQLCSGLEYAHNSGIVHRDIKPGNIMIARDDSVKVVDFGIAKMDSASMTQAGMVMGTPSYMSPEQIMGRPVDRRSDIFSLGVVLYETLTGEKPFVGEHWTTVSFKIVNDRHASALSRKREPSLLPDFDPILDKALAKGPAGRFQNCAELGLMLEQLLRDERIRSEPAVTRSVSLSSTRDAPGASSGAAINLNPDPGVAIGRSDDRDDRTPVFLDAPAAGGASVPVPPSADAREPSKESVGRAERVVDADSTTSPDSPGADPPAEWSFTISRVTPATGAPAVRRPAVAPDIPPEAPSGSRPAADSAIATAPVRRRNSLLLASAAAALVIAFAFVVMSRIRAVPAPSPPAVAPPTVIPAPAPVPSAIEESLDNARQALAQNVVVGRDGKDALHFVSAALALDPDNTEARALEADIRVHAMKQIEELRKQGKSNEVQAAWDMLLEDFPGDAEIQAKHDAAQATRSRTQSAAELERTRTAAARAFATNDYAGAVTQFGQLTRLEPQNAAAFYFLGRSYVGRGALTEAEKSLTRACKLEPRNPTYNIQLSQVLERNRKLTGALGFLEKGIELGGDRENSAASLKAHASALRFRIGLGQLTPHTFLSKHVHRFGGRCSGQLIVTESGISFVPDEQKDHAMQSSWENLRGFAVLKNRLEVELKGNKKLSFECDELDRLTRIAEVFSNRH